MSTDPAAPGGKEEKIRRALDVLGLAEGATRGHIRRAYRRLALAFHPDRHPGRKDMEERFQNVTEAYHLLMAALPGEGPGEGEASAGPAPERGRDIFFRVRLDFLQAARGGEMPVRLSRPARCPECGDAGREDCPACAGRGEVTEKAVIPVQVPAGIDEGGNFRVPGQGAPGRFGGPPGDLIIVVSCSGHPTLHRDGLTVYGVVQVPAFRLDEGGPVRVPTVQGGARIQIPPRTPSGRVFRLKGWGIHRAREGRTQEGDHVVRVVEMPESAEVWAERTSPRYRARSRR